MLENIAVGISTFLMELLGKKQIKPDIVPVLSWREAEIFMLPTQPDPSVEDIVSNYLNDLKAKGIPTNRQGVCIQSDWVELATHEGNSLLSGASLTKIATTLAALKTWGSQYQFPTLIYINGKVNNGILQGDLIVEGNQDPFFVWEEAFALGNALNELGIRRVTGNLIITGNFSMNFNSNTLSSGNLLKQGINSALWSRTASRQYRSLSVEIPRPEVTINGRVLVKQTLPNNSQLVLEHKSLTLTEILKQMNIYSNNKMSQILADAIGGAKVVAQVAAKTAKFPDSEIQLINGSGLGLDNRISPRGACKMLIAIERLLQSETVGVVDLFPVAGRDKFGTIEYRQIPDGIAVKTGTLNQVSALAGMIPTKERGSVWFAIINYGYYLDEFRSQQDKLLQKLSNHWELIPNPNNLSPENKEFLGDPKRNILVKNP